MLTPPALTGPAALAADIRVALGRRLGGGWLLRPVDVRDGSRTITGPYTRVTVHIDASVDVETAFHVDGELVRWRRPSLRQPAVERVADVVAADLVAVRELYVPEQRRRSS